MRIPTDAFLSSLAALTMVAALGVTVPSAAQSQAPRASLVVTRGDGAQDCPDAVVLAEQVRAVAGLDLIAAGLSAGPSETWIQVAITRDFEGYRAQIGAFGRHHGARTLEDLGPGCASLADAIAVTLAIFLDPYASAPMLPFTPTSVAPAAPLPPTRVMNKQRTARRRPPLPEWFVDASGGAGFALLEHSQPLLGASFGIRLNPRWSLAVGGSFVFPDTKVGSPGTELEFAL